MDTYVSSTRRRRKKRGLRRDRNTLHYHRDHVRIDSFVRSFISVSFLDLVCSVCDDCWSNYLTSQISHGAASVFATCMGMQCNQDHIHKLGCQCKEMVPESLFAKYVKDEALLKKYKQWQLDSFVEGQRHIKWCPKPGCGLAVSYQSGGTKSIQCKCGHYFCYSYGRLTYAERKRKPTRTARARS